LKKNDSNEKFIIIIITSNACFDNTSVYDRNEQTVVISGR